MSVDSSGMMPSSKTEELQPNEKLISHARELAEKLEQMLERNNGEYPSSFFSSAIDPHQLPQDKEVMEELETFFEEDCINITSVEVGRGGNYEKDELKKLSDTVWLLKEVQAEDDLDTKKYYIIDKKRATELLEVIIEQRNYQIATLQAQNQETKKLLSGI
jgi:hypothetical protein